MNYAHYRKKTRLASMVLLSLMMPIVALADSASTVESASPPGSIRFVGKNLVATANGTFSSWKFTSVAVDPAAIDPAAIAEAEVTVEVDVASVDTGSSRRDHHLRAADFFDVEKFPIATVRVFGAKPVSHSDSDSNSRYTARFEVTIRDVTKTLDGQFDLTLGATARVEGSLMLNRSDFGVGSAGSAWNPLSITQQIPITFTAELRRDTD